MLRYYRLQTSHIFSRNLNLLYLRYASSFNEKIHEKEAERRRVAEENIFFYSHRKAGKGYSNYSDNIYEGREKEWPPLKKLRPHYFGVAICMTILFALTTLEYTWFRNFIKCATRRFRRQAISRVDVNKIDESENSSQNAAKSENITKPKKKRLGFRERRIVEYENRIRLYSTPDKIFRYFATIKVYPETDSHHHGHNFEVFMTPEDFVRSITPGVMQPEHLGLEKYRTFVPQKYDVDISVRSDSIFYTLGENGLISFSDYLFLLTVLSTSPRHFALAFGIFDFNGDGKLDVDEFEKVQDLMMLNTTVGKKHRDHGPAGSCLKHNINSALAVHFFGRNKTEKLTIDKFLNFQQLQKDIVRIEFDCRDPNDDGRITEWAFADMLLMHSGMPEKIHQKTMERVKRIYKNSDGRSGISLTDVESLFTLLTHIGDVDTALSFYRLAGLSIDRATLYHVTKTTTNVELPSHVIDVIFAVFDDDEDGRLSDRKFIAIMKRRLMRGLERPKDTGLFRMIDALSTCAWETLIATVRS